MRTKKGFTLIELMVAMGIIAVLVTMSVVAIQIVQRSLRDTQRRDIVNTLNLWLTGFDNATSFPSEGELLFDGTGVYFVTGTGSNELIVEIGGATTPDTETSPSGTAYCYESTPGSGAYSLAVQFENGGDLQLGNSGSDCTSFGVGAGV